MQNQINIQKLQIKRRIHRTVLPGGFSFCLCFDYALPVLLSVPASCQCFAEEVSAELLTKEAMALLTSVLTVPFC